MTTIGIVGFGVVGKALHAGFTKLKHTCLWNDPAHEGGFPKDELVNSCEIIFICVDTPTNKRGADLSNVYNAFNELHVEISRQKKQPILVIKSTVMPGTTDTLRQMYPYIAVNPEFLRERYAKVDFYNPDRIVVGSHLPSVKNKLMKLYEKWEPPKVWCTPVEAELIKYMSNAFLVVKVAYSQVVGQLCKMVGGNPDIVVGGIVMDHRIADSHLDILPGKISRDTPCLTKDFMALLKQIEASGEDIPFLTSAYAVAVEGAYLTTSLEIVEMEEPK